MATTTEVWARDMAMAVTREVAASADWAMAEAMEATDTAVATHQAKEDMDYLASTARVNSFF